MNKPDVKASPNIPMEGRIEEHLNHGRKIETVFLLNQGNIVASLKGYAELPSF